MNLEFPAVVEIVRYIKKSKSGRNLVDSEVAALQCAWDGISYANYIDEKERFAYQYPNCYKKVSRIKKANSIATSTSKLFSLVADYFGVSGITRSDFRREFQELLNSPKHESLLLQFASQENEIEQLAIVNNADDTVIESQDIRKVINLINTNKSIISIYGPPGIGKTQLSQYVANHYSNQSYLPIYTDLRYVDSFSQWGIDVLSQAKIEFDEEDFLKCLFELFATRDVLVIIDSIIHLEPKLKGFLEAFSVRKITSKSRFLICSQRDLSLGVSIPKYQLQGLIDEKDIQKYFSMLGLKGSEYWYQMAQFYGGNFREIEYVANVIREIFEGDVALYWMDDTRIISNTAIEQFESVNFSQLDYKIFSYFSSDEEHTISNSFRKVLTEDSSTGELFSRIHYLCELGYLSQKREQKTNLMIYAIAPLLRQYLIQEKIIEA